MGEEVRAWLRRVWRQKAWIIALVLYKLAEDRVLTGVNVAIDQLLGPDAAAVSGQLLPLVSWLAVPLSIIVILVMAYRDRHAAEMAYLAVRPEWRSRDRVGHWDGVREMAYDVRKDLQEAVARTGERVTVKELEIMKARVDSLEFNAAGYDDMWTQGGGNFWDPRARDKWDRRPRTDAPGPGWAAPLSDRVDYVISWLWRHNPYPRPVETHADWGWGSDMGS